MSKRHLLQDTIGTTNENNVECVLVSASHLHGGSLQNDASVGHVVAAVRLLFSTHKHTRHIAHINSNTLNRIESLIHTLSCLLYTSPSPRD